MKSRYFFGAAIVMGGLAITQAATHNHHAATLATTLTAADQAAQDTTLSQAALKDYTAKHMGTGRTVVLQAEYNRVAAAAQAASNPQSNGQVYAQAQAACAGKADSIVQARCVQAFVAAHSAAGTNPQAVAPPKMADYTKTFVSPAWTADSTGIALLAAIVLLVMGVYVRTLRR